MKTTNSKTLNSSSPGRSSRLLPKLPVRGVILAVARTALALVVGSLALAETGSQYKFGGPLRTTKGAVASVHKLASQAGIEVLDKGGNAVDAAVTMAFMLGVVRPEMTGPGGGGFMLYRSADGSKVAALDFREKAPADITENFRDQGELDDFKYLFFTGAGHRVVGVPGNIAGLAAALERYGTISLAEAIELARRTAETGFIVTGELPTFMLAGIPYLRLFPETAHVFLRDTVLYYPSPGGNLGTVTTTIYANTDDALWFKQPDHAASLKLIAEHGPDAFYRADLPKGVIARQLMAGFEKYRYLYPGATLITAEDLKKYEPVWRTPIRTAYCGHEILGVPPPASGGVFLAEVLNILEGLDLGLKHSNADHLHYLAEAMKIALADRLQHLADPDVEDDVLGMADIAFWSPYCILVGPRESLE